jgi:hypothetical protein
VFIFAEQYWTVNRGCGTIEIGGKIMRELVWVSILILVVAMLLLLFNPLHAKAEQCQIGVVMNDEDNDYRMLVKCGKDEPAILTRCRTEITRILNMPQEVLICCNEASPNSDEYFCVGTYVPTQKEKL